MKRRFSITREKGKTCDRLVFYQVTIDLANRSWFSISIGCNCLGISVPQNNLNGFETGEQTTH